MNGRPRPCSGDTASIASFLRSASASGLPEEQRRRLQKLTYERHFLLHIHPLRAATAAAADGASAPLCFDVSGSTGNVYSVTLCTENRRFHCTCPDFNGHAQRAGVECKHVLFVVWRVLKSHLSPAHWSEHGRCIPASQMVAWQEAAMRLQSRLGGQERSASENNAAPASTSTAATGPSAAPESVNGGSVVFAEADGGLVHPLLRRRYLELVQANVPIPESSSSSTPRRTKDGAPEKTTAPSSVAVDVESVRKQRQEAARHRARESAGLVLVANLLPVKNDNDECYVCYESLRQADRCPDLVLCTTCVTAMHRECADLWARTHDTCVLCMSLLPYARACRARLDLSRSIEENAADAAVRSLTASLHKRKKREDDGGGLTYLNVGSDAFEDDEYGFY